MRTAAKISTTSHGIENKAHESLILPDFSIMPGFKFRTFEWFISMRW